MSIRHAIAPAVAILSLVSLHDLNAQEAGTVARCPVSVVPARVSGLDLIGWQKFPREEFGAVFNYRAVGSFGADVYLYPPTDPLDEQVRAYKENLEIIRNRGELESFEVTVERELPGITGQSAGRHVVVLMRRGNQTQRSHFFVFPTGTQHIKVRITYPDGRFTDESIQAFISELLATLPRAAQPAAASEHDPARVFRIADRLRTGT